MISGLIWCSLVLWLKLNHFPHPGDSSKIPSPGKSRTVHCTTVPYVFPQVLGSEVLGSLLGFQVLGSQGSQNPKSSDPCWDPKSSDPKCSVYWMRVPALKFGVSASREPNFQKNETSPPSQVWCLILEFQTRAELRDPGLPLVLYCTSGRRE